MSVIKANTHQVGSNAYANKNVVLTVNNSGDLVISKGAHDQPTSWTEIGRVSNSGGFQSDAALLGTAGAVANTDLMVVNQGGINKKITAGTFRTEFATEAVAAKVAAEAARDAAQLASGVYATTAAGLAATTSGKYFNVPASSANESLILYLNSSGTAVEQKRYPSTTAVDDIYRERFLSSRAAFLGQATSRTGYAKRAAVLVLLGQSNNVPRGTAISGSVSADVYMPVAGNSMTYWSYNSLNAEMCGNWTDLASAVVDTQGASENPGSGAALALLGGTFSRVYMCSVAKGSTSLASLSSGGPVRNAYAVIHRLCDIARADGFEPMVVFYTHHGETDAYNGASESSYYSDGVDYYKQMQGFASDAMGRRDYNAPIAFHMPIAYGTFGTAPNMRNVARAIVRLARDIPGGMLIGGAYQFLASDGVHHVNTAVRQKGEQAGYILRDYFTKGEVQQCLQMVDATWSGASVTVVFNKEINYDTLLTFGTSLNASYALGGFEFLDDGSFIKINSIAAQGRKAILTLNSTPAGTTQTVQIASQAMTGTPGTFQSVAGSQIRANYTGPVGIYDHTKIYYEMASPQTIEARP